MMRIWMRKTNQRERAGHCWARWWKPREERVCQPRRERLCLKRICIQIDYESSLSASKTLFRSPPTSPPTPSSQTLLLSRSLPLARLTLEPYINVVTHLSNHTSNSTKWIHYCYFVRKVREASNSGSIIATLSSSLVSPHSPNRIN